MKIVTQAVVFLLFSLVSLTIAKEAILEAGFSPTDSPQRAADKPIVARSLVSGGDASRHESWKLVWADEFEKPGLPNPQFWIYEEGFLRNEEKQYYTKARSENCRVENGMLIIEGRKEEFPNARYDANAKPEDYKKSTATARYTSASITTEGKVDWLYGRIEVRAKLPKGKGVWPAIWTLGFDTTHGTNKVGWPRCGEIDVMEHYGYKPETIFGTAHWGKSGKEPLHKQSGNNIACKSLADDFHLYAIEWFADHIDFFFDQTMYHTVQFDYVDKNGGEGDNTFRTPHYLLLNLALGDRWKEIDDSIFPQQYLIDYVRVYQQTPNINFRQKEIPQGAEK